MDHEKTCCVTGHRDIPAEQMDKIRELLRQEILTAIEDDYTHFISGFAAGGDEYITKPVSLPVLEAQVAASLRRDRRRAAPASVRFDEELTINYTDRTLRFRGQEIPLARKEFDILALLSQNPGVVLSKERIYERVWGFDSEGDSATVSEHVRRVRGKLSAAGARCPIETVWGCGYRWSRQEA